MSILMKVTGLGTALDSRFSSMEMENTLLKELLEGVLTIVKKNEAQNEVIISKLADFTDELRSLKRAAEEVEYLGKKTKISDRVMEKFDHLSVKEVKKEFRRITYGWNGTKSWTAGNLVFYEKWDAYFYDRIVKGDLPKSDQIEPDYYMGEDRRNVPGYRNKTKINALLNYGLKNEVMLVLSEMAKDK